ncbi:hypothetical protein ACFW6S_24640 [Streptomyces sp. NPDC058740]|uniref:hypothetical protein n=1 Tax=Streptomyces sp. NPDC058740 TaxID=3346619 RepID=UPI0036C6AD17
MRVDGAGLVRGSGLGIVGAWAEGERRRLVEMRGSTEERLAALDQPQQTVPPGWPIVEAQGYARSTDAVMETATALVREVCGGGHVRARAFRPLYAPIPPGTDPVRLVEWAVDTFPYEPAGQLPAAARRPGGRCG